MLGIGIRSGLKSVDNTKQYETRFFKLYPCPNSIEPSFNLCHIIANVPISNIPRDWFDINKYIEKRPLNYFSYLKRI